MTEFHVEVVRIGSIEKHPGADTLSVTNIHGGYPVEAFGKTKTTGEWAKEQGISYFTIRERIRAGWDPERALTQPSLRKGA